MGNMYKISKKCAIQYFAIYVMLLFNQSNFYEHAIKTIEFTQYAIVALFFVIALLKYRKYFNNTFIFVTLLLGFVIFERILSGGIGLGYWCEVVIKILITYIAISIDIKYFLTRFIKIVCFFAIVSLVFWLLQIMGLNLAKVILPQYQSEYYKTSYDYSGFRTVSNIPEYGRLIYSYSEFYQNRNTSIFTEPGIYQSVLNSAIFCLTYFTEYIFIKPSNRLTIFIFLSLCLLSTQSTSGYIGYAVVVLGMLIKKSDSSINFKHGKWKRYIIKVVIIGFIFIGLDYVIRGNESLLSVTILLKLFTESGRFSLEAKTNTGIARISTIKMAILAMFQHPLGIGFDKWYEFSSTNEWAGAGGWPFKFGAVLGIVPLCSLIYWIFSPMRYLKGRAITIAVFIFLYLNTSLAQTSAFYPVLIMIPIFLSLKHTSIKIKSEIHNVRTK